MKQLEPLVLTETHIKPIEAEIQRLFDEVIFLPLVRALSIPSKELHNAVGKPLYVRRQVLNAADIIDWAKRTGFQTTLAPDDMHVTVCYSRRSVDWSRIQPKQNQMMILHSEGRKLEPLGDKGAYVLKFFSRDLQTRWAEIRSQGASWDYPSYQPHITISYQAPRSMLNNPPPYMGSIILGPEIHEALDLDWSDKITEVRNAASKRRPRTLLEAIQEGTVYHQQGHFYGEFNSVITKELRALGAKYNPRSVTWSLTAENIPMDLRSAQAYADGRYDQIRKQVLRTIDDMKIESIDQLSTSKEKYRTTINWMEGDFQKTVQAISIVPKLTEDQRRIIATQWGENLDLYIKNWVADDILELRQKIEGNTFEGRRAEDMVKYIQKNYGTSKAKARFLARQETSLLMSKFQETRYRDIGSDEYRWSGANDARERADHKALNGKVFRWSDPPVTNRRTGAKNHPGEDFGCRCIAIPLVD